MYQHTFRFRLFLMAIFVAVLGLTAVSVRVLTETFAITAVVMLLAILVSFGLQKQLVQPVD